MNQDKLLQCKSFSDVIETFQNAPHDRRVIECHQFMKVRLATVLEKHSTLDLAFEIVDFLFFLQDVFEVSGSISSSKISKLREECKERLAES